MQDLFDTQQNTGYQPLAARMRPQNISEYVGQAHLLGPGKSLSQVVAGGPLHSMILWGPPGVGKTTLARLLSQATNVHFINLSAVMSGVKDIRAAVEEAQQIKIQSGRSSLLFVDEVHRFNKSQQDAFLPYVEDGTFIFIGATTENPAFELNNALMSRARVYILKSLQAGDLLALLNRTLADKDRGLGHLSLQIDDKVAGLITRAADGDARRLLNILEIASDLANDQDGQLSIDLLAEVLQTSPKRYDKGGDIFYDQISAFHKSVRGSDPNASLYWLARMLDAGCDPLYIARRLLAIASEDIGNADPRALEVTTNAWLAFERLGPAEGNRAIAHAAVYCACAPKSNAVHMAFKAAMQLVQDEPGYDVPEHLRNAPTKLAKSMGHGAEYRYAHNEEQAFAAGECYLPPELADLELYQPTNRGLESKIADKLASLQQLNQDSPTKRYK
ncbi:MAG: recombination factor protein RarA [Oceanospirillaceae bacterium]|nr:recombination factor protein RarA [Oceanospirillaceae bacterium]HCI02548.1 recombination factor protein RarA [Oceanospirillaceae bacterium]